jgi:S-DNA-T family DNA segregation ATPase FtsK/SpoIIIE
MAKKKKQTRRRKSEPEVIERSSFWPLTGAIILIVAALFLLLGGFGTGGPLPVGMFGGAYWLFGWGAYLTPLALLLFGIWKFVSEDHQIPFNKLTSMMALLVMAASWFHVGFIDTTTLLGGHGGAVGRLVGGAVLGALDKMPAAILFFIFSVLMFFLTFGISPTVLLKLADLFERPERDDTDLAELKSKAQENGFKLNEGVPVEHPSERDKARLATLKNTAQQLTPAENHQALTTASDPNWEFPPIDLLNQRVDKANAGDVEGSAELIKETFANFDIDVEMEGATVGPTVTQYTLKPPSNVKLTKITALENNLALSLAAHSLRMEAPIPGKRAVGIEVPNVKPAIVRISSLLQSNEWRQSQGPLSFTVGKDINGTPIIGDLADMPHVLIAGQTKSGKSVMINTMLTSLIYRNAP